jgi:hypothetical protein
MVGSELAPMIADIKRVSQEFFKLIFTDLLESTAGFKAVRKLVIQSRNLQATLIIKKQGHC